MTRGGQRLDDGKTIGRRQDDKKRTKTGWQDGEDEAASCHCLRNSWLGSSYSRRCRSALQWAAQNLNNTILLLTDTTDCIYNHCQCRSSIFYDMAEVLQQDAIDLIFLTTAWDYDLPIVELSSYQLFKPAPDWIYLRLELHTGCWTVSLLAASLILSPLKSREKDEVVWKQLKPQQKNLPNREHSQDVG